MDETKPLSDLQHPSWNPRRISEFDFNNLVTSIQTFGDLSGVVKNIQTGHLVGGNQRLEAFRKLGGTVQITQRMSDGPTAQGTVALGYIVLPNGETFGYREVMWDELKERQANIAANRIQGEWDQDLLAELNHQILDMGGDLDVTGQSDEEIDALLKAVGPDPEPNEQEDGTKPLHVRFTDDQLAMVYEAIGLLKRTQNVANEPNADLDANALYYICKAYVEANTSQTEPTVSASEPALPETDPIVQ